MSEANYSWIDRLAKRIFFTIFSKIEFGKLIAEDNGTIREFGKNGDLQAKITILHPRFYSMLVFDGNVGAGEAYMSGYWKADDLAVVVRIIVLNQKTLLEIDHGLSKLTRPFKLLYHSLNKNTRAGSERNIAFHYDLGNDFYKLFLDESMMYSCAIFESPSATLESAQFSKNDRICKKLGLTPGMHLIEIGTGWGGFAIHAAKNYGCKVTTTTISKKQYELARERVATAGLEDKIHVLFQDYRDLQGKYDRLVSIEMIEAVGHEFLNTYFKKCSDLLHPDGLMLIQAITTRDQHYENARKYVDFIQHAIFPGSFIPSINAICNAVTLSTDLRLFHLEDITVHYATTLHIWRERFWKNIEKVRALGYSETFILMWEFYLAFCEGSFAERYTGDVQMVFSKPSNRRAPILPAL